MKISLRTKLITSSLAVIVICGLVATLVGIHLIGTGIIIQAQEKVRMDLNSARQIYQDEIENIRLLIRLTSKRFFIKNALLQNDVETLKRELDQIRKTESLDILTLTDKNGQVIVRSRNPRVYGDSQSGDELVNWVLSRKQEVAGTSIISRENLLKEDQALAQRAHIEFIPTPKAVPKQKTEETSGMAIKAASPVLGYDGHLIGVLYGGNLLNRNYEIVDKVKDIVYQRMRYKDKDIGTVTIFQSDLRISTNVTGKGGSRAVGTRVSREVNDRVLLKGLPWIGRAFVVNDWYITTYEPIKNIREEIIGILYVGVLEEKFVDMKIKAIFIFLGITLAGMIAALLVSCFLAGGLLKPIKNLVFASQQLAKGDLEHQVKIKSKDEIGELGEGFNFMASSLKERDRQLKEYAQQQIMKSERLATLGQLAAGVAHEINNPLGAVLMYTHLSLEEMDVDDPRRENLEKSVREASRCKNIVKGLLDFARQSEPKIEESDINDILKQTLSLIEKQALFQNVKITRDFSPSVSKLMVDASQMQQVFTNIVLNAAEAMEGYGELTVATRMAPDEESVEIEFADTGAGISEENLEKLFDPFFTTKEVGRGTGLGLAISYGIITRHRGTIEAKSESGKGATLIVRLPLKIRKD